ncbi:alpha/beta hydrolase [Streptantibioticus ferralitis]|uniref:Alpha/beta hydrolase n=1 Tax=Streptantibioticus ferralitis TaxID=236510 RepID=A0ABT5Z414_9ACTN|nr:alpha/beta hydrolase [Streptantibioticus ferralitis]MDF2258543.1 alpha/beta hydrolase [Streptantibioticus ferralitis]
MPPASHVRSGRRALALTAALTAATALNCGTSAARPSAAAHLDHPALTGADRAAARYAPCGKPPATLEKQDQAFLNQLAAADGTPLYKQSYAAARQVLNKLQAGPIAKLPADISERTVPGGPTGPVSIRVVRPAGVKGPLPGIIYTHGGGWVLGNAQTHDRLVRQIANGARAAVVFVNYTPSPEAHFPVPIEQAYTVARWVARNGSAINVDASRLAIAGDSVGGNMAAAVTMLANQRGGPRFRQQVLLYPVTDARFTTASYNRFADGCWLTRPAMEWFWNAYAPDVRTRAQPLASPLRAGIAQLRGLPRALVITDSDVLTDEGNAYAAKLRTAGVPVTTTHYAGITHDFMMLDALAGTQADKQAVAQTNSALRQALYGSGRGRR